MTADFFSTLPYGLWPKQKVFLSIDVIVSTLLKMEPSSTNDGVSSQRASRWTEQFFNFFSEAPPLFANYYKQITNDSCMSTCEERISSSVQKHQKTCNSPVKWKLLGDEVILTENIICPQQVYYCLKALVATINELHRTTGLKFKGTAWVTGIPVANAPLQFQLQENMYHSTLPHTPRQMYDGYDVRATDVIGSSMDLGFRLAKFSTETKLVISTSFLKLLLDAQELIDEKDCFAVYSNGFTAIRGVKDGKHPLFWIIPATQHLPECTLFTETPPEKLRAFLKEYFKDDAPFIFDPENIAQRGYAEKFQAAIHHQARLPGSIYQLYKNHANVDAKEDAIKDAQNYIMSHLQNIQK